MLPWHLDEIKFGQQYKTAMVVSTATHIFLCLMVVLISELSILAFQNKIIEIIETEPINVELVHHIPTNAEVVEKPKPILPVTQEIAVQPTNEPDALPIVKAKEMPVVKEVTRNVIEMKRYEQLLSKHFESVLPKLPKDLMIPDKVFVWLKVDKSGNIYDYGFKPTQKDQKTINFLDSAVAMATPVPSPPESDFVSQYAQYLIPMNFR